MTESADTVGTHAVSAICGYAVRTDTISTVCGYTIRTDAVSTVCSYAVCTHTVSTICGYAVRTNAISTVCGYAVRANAVGTIFNDAEALQGTLVATFGNAVGADTICAIFSDDRGSGLFGGNLRQGESAGRQGGDNEAGEDLLFHGRSPKEGGK